MLSLERGRGADLQQSIAQLNRELATASAARDSLSQQLAALQTQAERATADRDTLRSERDRLAQQLADAALQARSGAARAERLQQDLAASASRTDAAKQETATVATQLAEARRQLGDTTGRLADARRSLPRCSARSPNSTRRCRRTRTPSRRSCPISPSWPSRTARSPRCAMTLEKQAQDAAARAMTDQQRRAAVETQLAEEKQLGNSARAQIALLNQQVDELKAQLTVGRHGARADADAGAGEGHADRQSQPEAEYGAGDQGGGIAALSQRILRQAARGAGEPPGNPDRRRSVRVPERGAVPARQRRPDAGGPERHHRARHHHQGHRRGRYRPTSNGSCASMATPTGSRSRGRPRSRPTGSCRWRAPSPW